MDKCDLLIFDCDGVLIDSEPLACGALAEAMTAAGHPMTQTEGIFTFCGNGAEPSKAIMREQGLDAEAVYADATRRMNEAFAQRLQAMSGMERVLKAFAVKLAVASNSGIERLRLSLGRTPLWPLFRGHVYSAEHVARGKPAPDLALYCLDQLAVPASKALFIDDNLHGIHCARTAGIRSIGFVDANDPRPDRASVLKNAGADFVVTGAGELFDLLAHELRLTPAATVT